MLANERDGRIPWRLGGRELLLIFVFWTSLAAVSSVNRLLDPRGFGFRVVSPAGPIALAFIESWVWAAVTPLIFWLSSRVSLGRYQWLRGIPLLIVAGIVISISVYGLLEVARETFFDLPRRGGGSMLTPLQLFGRLRFLNQLLVYMAVLAAGFAREYFDREQTTTREAAVLERRATALQAQLAEAKLDALRMQLNPHFLFNTLHAISALVERDPAGVRRMIARLSELLRQTIDANAADEVTLGEELAFLRGYFEIMEIRFQGRLTIEVDVAGELLGALVPSLILQPVVENAFEHGAARAERGGVVSVMARRSGGSLVLTVRDNGPGVASNASSGVGVTNTRARLAELFGDAASLTLSTAPGGGAMAEIVLPFRTEEDEWTK